MSNFIYLTDRDIDIVMHLWFFCNSRTRGCMIMMMMMLLIMIQKFVQIILLTAVFACLLMQITISRRLCILHSIYTCSVLFAEPKIVCFSTQSVQ